MTNPYYARKIEIKSGKESHVAGRTIQGNARCQQVWWPYEAGKSFSYLFVHVPARFFASYLDGPFPTVDEHWSEHMLFFIGADGQPDEFLGMFANYNGVVNAAHADMTERVKPIHEAIRRAREEAVALYSTLPKIHQGGALSFYPYLFSRAYRRVEWVPTTESSDWSLAVIMANDSLDGFKFRKTHKLRAAHEWMRRFATGNKGDKQWAQCARLEAIKILAEANEL